MNNSKKYLIASVGILLFILFIIFILQNLLVNRSGSRSVNIVPTPFIKGANSLEQWRLKKEAQQNAGNTGKNSGSSIPSYMLKSDEVIKDEAKKELEDQLPIETADFKIAYSKLMDKIVVTRKSLQADQKLKEWGEQTGYDFVIQDYTRTFINNQSVEELEKVLAQPTEGISVEKQIAHLSDLTGLFLNGGNDILKNMGNLPIDKSTPTPIPSPTSTLQSQFSSSTNSKASSSYSSSVSNSSSVSKNNNNYVYYPQCDGPYDKTPLTPTCNLCDGGCGPTTVAMILSSYVDPKFTPPAVVDIYKANDALGCGTRISDAKNIFELNGVQTSDYMLGYDGNEYIIDDVVSDFRSYLQNGWTIFTLANYKCTSKPEGCYHFFWITDIDEKGNVMAYDPYYGKNTRAAINENARYPDPKYVAAFGVKK